MRTVLFFIYFFGYLLFKIPVALWAKALTKKGEMEKRDIIVNKTVTQWATTLLKIAGVNVTVTGMENIPKEAHLIVPNHQSNFDVPIMLSCLDKPKGFFSKIEVKKIPIVPLWMEYIACVFVDRSNPRQGVKAILEGAQNLKDGKSLIIFPEGTRSKGGPVGEFKNGAFRVAEKSKAPVVPVRIDGSFRAMEANGGFIKPCDVEITIFNPIITKDYTKEDFANLPALVRGVITNEG